MRATSEAVKAAVAVKAQARLVIGSEKTAIDLRPPCEVETQSAEYFLEMSDRLGESGVVETSCCHKADSRWRPPDA